MRRKNIAAILRMLISLAAIFFFSLLFCLAAAQSGSDFDITRDGSRGTAIFYAGLQNYQDEAGAWHRIEPEFAFNPETRNWEAAKGIYKAVFDLNGYSLDYGGAQLRFEPVYLRWEKADASYQNIGAFSPSGLVGNGGELSYNNAFGIAGFGLSYQYSPTRLKSILTVQSDKMLPPPTGGVNPGNVYLVIKEKIVLLNTTMPFSFSTQFRELTAGAVPVSREGKAIYLLSAPEYWSADQHHPSAGDHRFIFDGTDLFVETRFPYSWIIDRKRGFPLYLDATLDINYGKTITSRAYRGSSSTEPPGKTRSTWDCQAGTEFSTAQYSAISTDDESFASESDLCALLTDTYETMDFVMDINQLVQTLRQEWGKEASEAGLWSHVTKVDVNFLGYNSDYESPQPPNTNDIWMQVFNWVQQDWNHAIGGKDFNYVAEANLPSETKPWGFRGNIIADFNNFLDRDSNAFRFMVYEYDYSVLPPTLYADYVFAKFNFSLSPPDVNLVSIEGHSFASSITAQFWAAKDGNLAIDFNLKAGMPGNISVDINYSTEPTAGTGRIIAKNVIANNSLVCDSTDFSTAVLCHWDWNAAGIYGQLEDANYYIIIKAFNTEGSSDSDAKGSFAINNNPPTIAFWRLDNYYFGLPFPFFRHAVDGNLTVDFNSTNPGGNSSIFDLNNSVTSAQGDGNAIRQGLNLNGEFLDCNTFLDKNLMDKNLLAYYKLNSNDSNSVNAWNQGSSARELWGYDWNATLFGGMALNGQGKWQGGAALFDGVDDYIRISHPPEGFLQQPFNRRQISLWFKAYKTTGTQVLFEEGDGNAIRQGLNLNGEFLDCNTFLDKNLMDKNLLAYYKLNSNDSNSVNAWNQGSSARELWGYDWNATLFGGMALNGQGKWQGGAALFDGVDDYIRISHPPEGFLQQPFNRRQISLWFKAYKTTGTQVLFEEGDVRNGIGVQLSGRQLQVANCISESKTLNTYNVPLDANRWYHVFYGFFAGGQAFYVNGKQQFPSVLSPSSIVNAHTSGAALGATDGNDCFGATSTGNYFSGLIEEVKVWDKISVQIPSGDINADYNSALSEKMNCRIDFNIIAGLVPDGNYFLLSLLSDGNRAGFLASPQTAGIDNNPPSITWIFPWEQQYTSSASPYFTVQAADYGARPQGAWFGFMLNGIMDYNGAADFNASGAFTVPFLSMVHEDDSVKIIISRTSDDFGNDGSVIAESALFVFTGKIVQGANPENVTNTNLIQAMLYGIYSFFTGVGANFVGLFLLAFAAVFVLLIIRYAKG